MTHLEINGRTLDELRSYSVVVPEFLAKGYYGFHWFRASSERSPLGLLGRVLRTTLSGMTTLPAIDGRLKLLSNCV